MPPELVFYSICMHNCGPGRKCPVNATSPLLKESGSRGWGRKHAAYRHGPGAPGFEHCDPSCPGFSLPQDDNGVQPDCVRPAWDAETREGRNLWTVNPTPKIAGVDAKHLPTRMQVIFVPDPLMSLGAHSLTRQGEGFLHVSIVRMPERKINQMRQDAPGTVSVDVPDDVHPDSQSEAPGTFVVALWEMAYLTEAMRNMDKRHGSIEVVGLEYKHFIEAILSPSEHKEVFSKLQSASMIIGGAALNEDWTVSNYGLHDEEGLKRYLRSMQELQRTTVIFPNPRDLLLGGHKIILTKNLDRIARELGSSRPKTSVTTDPSTNETDYRVVKRPYSARAECVVVRDGDEDLRADNVHTVGLKYHKKPPATASTGSSLIDKYWLRQPYIPQLQDWRLGELRCFVIGGVVTRIIQTSPMPDGGTWTEHMSSGCPSLRQGYNLFRHASHVDDHSWVRVGTESNLTHVQLQDGRKELESFVTTHLRRLIEKEKRDGDMDISDLELFCRVDVGILRSAARMDYFILEVERGLTTCLFSWANSSHAYTDLNTLAALLPSWYARHAATFPSADL